MLKIAPWQELSEALLIAAAAGTVNVAVAPAATLKLSPVLSVNVTPVEALQAAPLSEVTTAAACSVTEVTLTGNWFGFVTLTLTSLVAPGYKSALVEAEASLSVSADAVAAFA